MGYFELRKSEKETKEPYYFVLKSGNHEVIVRSEMYPTKAAAQKGIASVQKNGATTEIKDKTV